jgi:lysozyme
VAGLIAPGTATSQSTAPPPGAPPDSQAPRLDRNDPNGAWAGYSVEQPGEQGSAARDLPAGAVAGMDVSGHQGDVDWDRAWNDGARFAYVKATEGMRFRSPTFGQQYDGSAETGMIRGAYHFALPNTSTGAEQANFFVDHGGGWTPDGSTLPGALDIEHNPYGDVCYGMNPTAMSGWVRDFSDTYNARTGRFPVFYTTTAWWNRCTGGDPSFGANNPLWLARHAQAMGPLPAGWGAQTIWQFSPGGVFPGDQNTFNGDLDQLQAFAG